MIFFFLVFLLYRFRPLCRRGHFLIKVRPIWMTWYQLCSFIYIQVILSPQAETSFTSLNSFAWLPLGTVWNCVSGRMTKYPPDQMCINPNLSLSLEGSTDEQIKVIRLHSIQLNLIEIRSFSSSPSWSISRKPLALSHIDSIAQNAFLKLDNGSVNSTKNMFWWMSSFVLECIDDITIVGHFQPIDDATRVIKM